MLKRLRIRFVALTMVIVGIVLTCVSAAICVGDYQRSVADVYDALEGAVSPIAQAVAAAPDGETDAENAGQSHDAAKGENGIDSGEAMPGTGNDPADESGADSRKDGRESDEPAFPVIGGKDPARDRIIPIAAYTLAEDGAFESIDARTTASIDDDVLEEALSRIADTQDGHGSFSSLGLFYAKRTYDIEGEVVERIAFADQSAARHGSGSL